MKDIASEALIPIGVLNNIAPTDSDTRSRFDESCVLQYDNTGLP